MGRRADDRMHAGNGLTADGLKKTSPTTGPGWDEVEWAAHTAEKYEQTKASVGRRSRRSHVAVRCR